MSDTAQGPGWWQASDGKWYPPQGQAFAPPQKSSGCLKGALITLGILAVLGVIAIVAVGNAAEDVVDDIEDRQERVLDDVIVSGCDIDPVTGFLQAAVDVTNHSSERSNYGIDVTFEAPDGRQIDTGFASVTALEPGQSTTEQVVTFTAPEGEFTCRVADVTRFTDEP